MQAREALNNQRAACDSCLIHEWILGGVESGNVEVLLWDLPTWAL